MLRGVGVNPEFVGLESPGKITFVENHDGADWDLRKLLSCKSKQQSANSTAALASHDLDLEELCAAP